MGQITDEHIKQFEEVTGIHLMDYQREMLKKCHRLMIKLLLCFLVEVDFITHLCGKS